MPPDNHRPTTIHSSSWDPAPKSMRRWGVVGLTTLGFLLSQFYRISTAVISPDLARDLSLTSSQLGDLAAAFFYAFALSQVPLGIALDRLGSRYTMTAMGLAGVLGAGLFAGAQGELQATLGRVFLGIGMSCNLMGTLTLLAAWFPVNRFAFISGIVVAIGTFGNLMAATPLALLAEHLGWRGGFAAIALVNLLQVIGLFIIVRDRPEGVEAPVSVKEAVSLGFGAFLRSYGFWALALGTFVRYGFFVALQGLWAVPFLVYAMGYSPVGAANVMLVMAVGMMIGLPSFGKLSDNIIKSRKHVVWPSLLGSALLVLSLCLWSRQTHFLVVYATFFGLGAFSAAGQIMYAHVKELVPPDITARAMTGINLFTMLGGAVFTQVLGMLLESSPSEIADPSGFNPVWYLGGACLLTVSIGYMFTKDSKAL